MLNIEQSVEQRFPLFSQQKPWVRHSALGLIRKLVHEHEINAFLERNRGLYGFDFIDQVLDHFQLSYQCTQRDRLNIPATGAVVIVANHPLGALDGLALLRLIGDVRTDVKIIANDLLLHFDALHALLLPVDNLHKATRKANIADIYSALGDGQAVIIFPAGEVSRMQPNGIYDGKWTSGFLALAEKQQTPILPIYIDAKNSALFYGASFVFRPLGGIMLAHEMFGQQNKTIDFRIGAPIPYAQIKALPVNKTTKAKLVRKHLYRIAKAKKPIFATEQTIVHPKESRSVKKELQQSQLLGQTSDNKKIFLFDYRPDSAVMHEIGRLREITFRQVGEGTGRKRDLDFYDQYYRHLVLWDEETLEIAGAYRLADVAAIKAQADRTIYTEELFCYSEAMAPFFAKGVELGRSFVSPTYWGKRSLDYLWAGIGAYLQQYPQTGYLFGPVSLSNRYPDFAKALIVRYYQHYYPDQDQLAQGRTAYRMPIQLQRQVDACFSYQSQADDFMQLREQLAHMQVTVPTLYKQYADVCEPGGVRFCDFNIDANFSHCIDGLVLIDLTKLTSAKRKRYLGGV